MVSNDVDSPTTEQLGLIGTLEPVPIRVNVEVEPPSYANAMKDQDARNEVIFYDV